MNPARYLVLVYVMMLAFACGCGLMDDEEPDPENTYEHRLNKARKQTDDAEKLYHKTMELQPGRERTARLEEAYDLAGRAMDILNKLDDEFGKREVPPGEVLAHIPVMRKCTKLRSDIIRTMPIPK